MIAVLLLTLRHRWRRALTLCLLSAFTYGVAVAVPAFLAAADRTMIANELAHATTPEVSISASQTVSLSHGRDRSFESSEPSRLSQPWLDTTFAVAVNVDTADAPPGADPRATVPQLVYRQDYCAHVRLLSGRCPLTTREVLIGTDLATLLHVGTGGQATLRWTYLGSAGWVPSPDPMTVSIVGIYRPTNLSDPYWGTEAYFSAGQPSPILAERGTIDALSHAGEEQSVDAVLRPDGLSDATLTRTTRWVSTAAHPSADVSVNTQIPALLTRIAADRRTIREVLPDIAAALILVGCFVLFLAISHAVADRTVEVGVVRLRGAGTTDRWWLAAGESIAPTLLGIPLGLLGGSLLASGAAAVALPHTGGVATATGGLLGIATIALILLTAILAHLRTLSAPVTELLRRVPARIRGWRAATPHTLVAALALVALAQLYLQPGPLTGIMLIAPALIVVTLGLLAGQAVLPAAAVVGRWAIARPRHLGLGLGALALARRPGAHLLLAVQVIALALVGFAAADLTAARQARTEWVALDLGAPRVIDTGEVAPSALLAAVRAADPSGRYAMAAITLPRHESADPTVLAIDAPRLAAVATWPSQAGVSAATVGTLLHPTIATPAAAVGSSIVLETDTTAYETDFGDAYTNRAGGRVGVTATFALADGSAQVTANLGNLRLGDATMRASVPACRAGCVFTGLVVKPRAGSGLRVDTVIRGLSIGGTPVPLPWADGARWRTDGTAGSGLQPAVAGGTAGLDVSVPQLTELPGGVRVALVDAPATLPIVTSGASSIPVQSAGGHPVATHPIGARQPVLPGLGARGGLVDLQYLIRMEPTDTGTAPGQVWLAGNAPASVVAALADHGVVSVADRTAVSELSYLDRQGPAIGIAFQLAAAAAALLLAAAGTVLMAGVERTSRAAELRTLRVQGLSPAAGRRAAVTSHLGLVALATLAGCAVGAAAWWLTGRRLPIFTDAGRPDLPTTPAQWYALVVASLVGAAVLGTSAAVAARSLVRRTR